MISSTNDSVDAGFNFIPNNKLERNLYFYHPDHLGSSSYITDKDGKVIQHTEYIAFGEILFDEHNTNNKQPYLFNGKELDSETGLYYYGARYYDPKTSIFLNVDPLAEKTGTPYAYTYNNPIRYIDPDGKVPQDVIITFYKTTGKLLLIDKDHYKQGLPIKMVSAKVYQLGGIRDRNGKLTHNQVLVMENVFSGGRVEKDGTITRNLKRDKYEQAIPNGRYDLTEYEGGKEWYKVDPIDAFRYDDHHQGYTNADGKNRNGYRFHLGGLSHGCITVCDPTKQGRKDEWEVIGKILENTSKTEVPKREGMQKYIPWTKRLKYGEIKVIGDDSKKIKKQN